MLQRAKDGKKGKKDDKLTGKRKKRNIEDDDDVGDFFAKTEIEVVP